MGDRASLGFDRVTDETLESSSILIYLVQEQIDQERSNELDQDVLAQFVVQLKELKDELDEMMKDRIRREKELEDFDA